MTASTDLSDTPVILHQAHGHSGPADACMFCDPSLGLRASGEDPLAFREHLQHSAACMQEYELWKTTMQNEWLGD